MKLASLIPCCLMLAQIWAQAATSPPNIIVIMTDDMGYSDLGCYGSEIETPNLDGLAAAGIRFSQFYNTSRCCPTRASLMTGLYAHQAGLGGMMGDEGPASPGYRGRLMPHSVTIAEALGDDYLSIHTGKWHLGDKKKEWWPLGRGFDRCYSCPQGGGFYFRPSSFRSPRVVVRGNTVLYDQKKDPPADWYATDAYTDEGLKYVAEAVEARKPFFWYLAYNAPHFPLQAKPEDIAKYRGRYKVGWDALRQQRYERLIELGLIDANWPLPPRDSLIPAWDSLSDADKDGQDERMAIYAAMIDCVDQNIGKIVASLKELQVFENTLILFLHDNGAQWKTGGHMGSSRGKGTPGAAESDVHYGTCWANVSDVPFRKYKALVHEGGIATPLIAHWPKGIVTAVTGKIAHSPSHVIDIMPTCLEMAGRGYPSSHKGQQIVPVAGKSLVPIFQGGDLQRNEPLFFEHMGNRAIRHGQWKLVADKGKPWELYDMVADRTEMQNLAADKPEIVQGLVEAWEDWARRCHVLRKRKAPAKSTPDRGQIPVASIKGIVRDDNDAMLTGRWSTGKNFPSIGSDYRYSSDARATAEFVLTAPKDATFDVQLSYASHKNRGTRVPVTLTAGDIRHDLRVDMRQPPPLPHGFLSLRQVRLRQGQQVTLRIACKDAGGTVHIDAARLLETAQ